MADDKNAQDPIEISTKGIHDDAEFMEAIDQQMDAITTKRKKPAKAKVEEAPQEETPQKQEVAQDTSEDGDKIAVRKAGKESDEKPEEDSSTSQIKVKQSAIKDDDSKQENHNEERHLSHSAGTIKPINDISKPEDEAEQAAESDENPDEEASQEEAVEEKVEVETKQEEAAAKQEPAEEKPAQEAPKEEAKQTDTAEKEEEPAQEESTQENETEEPAKSAAVHDITKDDEDQQNLKTFDTTKYHLPIKPTHHHRKHSVSPWTVVAMLALLALVIAVVAVDMELLDVGIKLPFDFF